MSSYLLKNWEAISDKNVVWEPTEEFSLNGDEKENWDQIKLEQMNDKIRVEDIRHLSVVNGTMLFHQFASKKYKQDTPIEGFEKTIRQWKGSRENIFYLETPQTSLAIIEVSLEDQEKYFKGALSRINKSKMILKERVMEMVDLADLYDYQGYLEFNKVKPSTCARNKQWLKKIMGRLGRQKNLPIFVVCGAAHLMGGIKEDSGSFLALLIKKLAKLDRLSNVERMTKEGEWISIKN